MEPHTPYSEIIFASMNFQVLISHIEFPVQWALSHQHIHKTARFIPKNISCYDFFCFTPRLLTRKGYGRDDYGLQSPYYWQDWPAIEIESSGGFCRKVTTSPPVLSITLNPVPQN